MLRLAVRLLLACVLCLNGFFAPVAMAHHGGVPAAAQSADHEGSCHESEAGDVSGHPVSEQPVSEYAGSKHLAPAADHGGKHGNCCKHGQCLCGCLLAANVPANDLSAPYAADSRTALPIALHVATVRYAVPLRPPIV